jgi:GT2 family glycosyltransferase
MSSNATMPSGKLSTNPRTSPRIAAVIVILRQSEEEILRCIHELAQQTLPLTHLFLHWNRTQPKSLTAKTPFRIHHIGKGKNVGWCNAINAGIESANKAKCTSILILNTDTKLPPKLLATLHEQLEKHQAGAISPTITSADKTIWYAGARLSATLGILRIPSIGKARPTARITQLTDSISGCCCLLSLTRCSSVRMNPDYFIYWDDPDLSMQIHKLGYSTLWTNLCSAEHISGTHSITPFQAYGYMRNVFIFLRRFIPLPNRAFGFAAQILIVFPYHLLRCRKQKSKENLVRGLLDGIKGYSGIFPKDLLP